MIYSIWFKNLDDLSRRLSDTELEPHMVGVIPDISNTTSEDAVWAIFKTTEAMVSWWVAKQRMPRPTTRPELK